MTLFRDRLEEYLGDAADGGDIRAVVRSCWWYDLPGLSIRMWQGQGRLYTADGSTWMGTIRPDGSDVHKTPRMTDGRDGTSLQYRFTIGYLDRETYEGLKADQGMVSGARLVRYYALFRPGEGLRPDTPIEFAKELTLFAPEFDEKLEVSGFSLVRRYSVSVLAKDGNFGRSEVPGRTYADTMQKQYARNFGVDLDRGCEFVAGLANRTYKVN